ncbi:uncharacterized protein MEPE_01351 [Melanopsichium pennsylvanicum]|uniref:Uncharacterized protein n=2 Tax=Melanopsichium pennsylvanicum TaxID=63383 RepID=A0AAJ4XIA9_9BASI|nr:putative protein [Melanopsichium pennsylvanicum 4]SNX82645.1 uncharacterized protein MEPE_01351 [Melanopsichium pennsylvanicum]
MKERNSSLFAKLSLRSKRLAATSSSSSSHRSVNSPTTTPETETPTSFSGPSEYGLGYSSINHECAPSYDDRRTSRALLSRPIELDPYTESCITERAERPTISMSRRNTRNTLTYEHQDALFVSILPETAPNRAVQSTVRARSGTSSPEPATLAASRPQSPFAMSSTVSKSLIGSPPMIISARKCQSVHDFEVMHPPSFAAVDQTIVTASPNGPYYAVGRGWKKGIYATKEEAECQTRNFPGPRLQIFEDRAAAKNFIANSRRFVPQASHQDQSHNDEFVERTRIFKGLDPNSELAKRRAVTMSAERKEAQRKSRVHTAMQSPALRQDANNLNSPPLSLRSFISDVVSVSPMEEIKGFGSFRTPIPLLSMSLLPVKHLASSIAFYTKVLGFTCVSQTVNIQAILSSSSASICLRTVDQAPPSSTGANVSRLSMIRTSSGDRLNPHVLGCPALPTICVGHADDAEAVSLPPTPESISLSCMEPEPLDLPSTTLPLRSAASTLSGATVLIEYSGALESMHSLLSARFNEWRLERSKAAQRTTDSARVLTGVQQTLWDAQELHLCDLDGHRIIYTTPFPRASPCASLI